jgi:hypothetical protein
VLPVATSKCCVPLASAMAAHVFWNRYTTLQSLPYLLHAAMASRSAAAIFAASPSEPSGSHIAEVSAIVQAFVKLPGCLPARGL